MAAALACILRKNNLCRTHHIYPTSQIIILRYNNNQQYSYYIVDSNG